MDQRLFQKRLYDAARELIPVGATVVCGVSGGLDSIVLLHGLHRVCTSRRCGWRLHVAHLDHGLRENSAEDARFVRDVAATLNIACTIRRRNVARAAQGETETVEEAARRVRYAFLEQVAEATGASCVAIAHHADDQAETVLHHIVRGTGLRGLGGMPAIRPIREGSGIRLVRPLLGVRRSEVKAYGEACGLTYREDPTNAFIGAATRNRIRGRILPMLAREMNPEISTALLRLATQARSAGGALRQWAEQTLNTITIHRTPLMTCLCREAFGRLPDALQREILMLVLRRLSVPLKPIGFERIEAVLDTLNRAKGKKSVQFPGGVSVEIAGGEIRVRAGDLSRAKQSELRASRMSVREAT